MATAKIERERFANGEGPLAKAHPNEPIFILRGQDMIAADAVEWWANHASLNGVHPDKVREARDLAEEMRTWPKQKLPD